MNVEDMVREWRELIAIADNTLQANPQMSHMLRSQYAEVIEIARNHTKPLNIELLESIQYLTDRMYKDGDPSFYSGQVMTLCILLGIHFPGLIGLAAMGYECAVKTYHADRLICPN